MSMIDKTKWMIVKLGWSTASGYDEIIQMTVLKEPLEVFLKNKSRAERQMYEIRRK